jgi:hypothetical protein
VAWPWVNRRTEPEDNPATVALRLVGSSTTRDPAEDTLQTAALLPPVSALRPWTVISQRSSVVAKSPKERRVREEATATTLQLVGAGCSGLVIGWFLYSLNRHRTAVGIGDLASVVSAFGRRRRPRDLHGQTDLAFVEQTHASGVIGSEITVAASLDSLLRHGVRPPPPARERDARPSRAGGAAEPAAARQPPRPRLHVLHPRGAVP